MYFFYSCIELSFWELGGGFGGKKKKKNEVFCGLIDGTGLNIN